MREILFKAKRVDNGDWVYGDLQSQALPLTSILTYDICEGYGALIPVIPETISQYTGLHDKNGKEIYEGNICKLRYFKNDYVGKVVFNQKTCSFEIQNYITVGTYGNRAINTRLLCHIEQIEIIGNIFDNPELLESEATK